MLGIKSLDFLTMQFKDLIEYSTLAPWVQNYFFFFFSVEIMFLSHLTSPHKMMAVRKSQVEISGQCSKS